MAQNPQTAPSPYRSSKPGKIVIKRSSASEIVRALGITDKDVKRAKKALLSVEIAKKPCTKVAVERTSSRVTTGKSRTKAPVKK